MEFAEYGSKKAYDWLTEKGFDSDFASKVADCIKCHRFRGSNVPKTIEAKILYDADKIAHEILYSSNEVYTLNRLKILRL